MAWRIMLRCSRPGEYMTISYATTDTNIGALLAAVDDQKVCRVILGDSVREVERELLLELAGAVCGENDPVLRQALDVLRASVEEAHPLPDLSLSMEGTPFQRRVWEVLRHIPAGTTLTYSEVAERTGAPGSSRAVAGACAANKLALLIPCHRVIRSDGSLSGYRWGAERKAMLLEREKAASG